MRKTHTDSAKKSLDKKERKGVNFDVDDEHFKSMGCSKRNTYKPRDVLRPTDLNSMAENRAPNKLRPQQRIDPHEVEIKIAKLLKSNAEMMHLIKSKESQIRDTGKIEELSIEFTALDALVQKTEEAVNRLKLLNSELDSEIGCLDDELNSLREAERDLEERADLLDTIINRVDSVKAGVRICLNLKALEGILKNIISRRMRMLWRNFRCSSEDQVPYELGLNMLISANQIKMSQAFRNLQLSEIEKSLPILKAVEKLKKYFIDEKLRAKVLTSWSSVLKFKQAETKLKKWRLKRLILATRRAMGSHLRELAYIPKVLQTKNPLCLTQILFKRAINSTTLKTPSMKRKVKISFPGEESSSLFGSMTLLPAQSVEATRDITFVPTTPRSFAISGPVLLAKAFFSLVMNRSAVTESAALKDIVGPVFKIRKLHRLAKRVAVVVGRSQRECVRTGWQRIRLEYLRSRVNERQGELDEAESRLEMVTATRHGYNNLQKVRVGCCILKKILRHKKQAVINMLVLGATNNALIKRNKRSIGCGYLEQFFQVKKQVLRRITLSRIFQYTSEAVKPDLDSMQKEIASLHNEEFRLCSELKVSGKKIEESKAETLNQVIRKIMRGIQSRVMSQIAYAQYDYQKAIIGLKRLQKMCKWNRKTKLFQTMSILRKRSKRIESLVVSLDNMIKKCALRVAIKSIKSESIEIHNKKVKGINGISQILERKLGQNIWLCIQAFAKRKENIHKDDLANMVEHSRNIVEKIKESKRFSASLHGVIREKDRLWLKLFIIRQNRLFCSAAVHSLIKPTSPVCGPWNQVFLLKSTQKIFRCRLRNALSEMYNSKMVLNVYDLQSKRDDAFNALSEIRKTLVEDYAAFNSAFSVYNAAKEEAEIIRAEAKASLRKLLPKLVLQSKYPTLATMFRRMRRFIAYKRSKLNNWHEQRLRKAWTALVHGCFYNSPMAQLMPDEPSSPLLKKMRRKLSSNIYSQEQRMTMRRAGHILQNTLASAVNRQIKMAIGVCREAGKERALRQLAEEVVRVRREAEKASKMRVAIYSRETQGLLAQLDIGDRQSLTKTFRAWKVRAINNIQIKRRMEVYSINHAWRVKMQCFRFMKSLRKSKNNILHPLKLKSYNPFELSFLRQKLGRFLTNKIDKAFRAKQRFCLRILKRNREQINTWATSKLILCLNRTFTNNRVKQMTASLLQFKLHAQASTQNRLAISSQKAHAQYKIARIFHSFSLTVNLPDHCEEKISKKKLPPKTTQLRSFQMLALRRSLHAWHQTLQKRKFLAKKITKASVALRKWRSKIETTETLQLRIGDRPTPRSMQSSAIDEDIKTEYKELHELVVQASKWEKRSLATRTNMKRQIRAGIGMILEGSLLNTIRLIQKLSLSRMRDGWLRTRRFSGGPTLVDSKGALAAMSRLIEAIQSEKHKIAQVSDSLAIKQKTRCENRAITGQLTRECIELEESINKVASSIVDRKELAREMRIKLKASLDEKNRLIAILQEMN